MRINQPFSRLGSPFKIVLKNHYRRGLSLRRLQFVQSFPARIIPSLHCRQLVISSFQSANKLEKNGIERNVHGPITEYNSRVGAGHLRNDDFQLDIVQKLQHLYDELQAYHFPVVTHPSPKDLKSECTSSLRRIFDIFSKIKYQNTSKILKSVPKGLYLYGDVGCGKTMLMDLFYKSLGASVASKIRIHFHNFMQDIHKRLHQIRMMNGEDFDAIPLLAAEIAEKANILCFDEFQCTDVADAMILRRLLETLMSHGVVLVTTSNRHPDDLYLNGIQRESFIPCIDLLKDRLDVISLNSPIDYRKIQRPSSGVYHAPLDFEAAKHAERWFKYFGKSDQHPHSEVQYVWSRQISVPKVIGRAAMFTFNQLIGCPMSAADYIELTKSYDAFIVTDIPRMTYRERDLARRFITFIDAVYEAKAGIVLTSAVPLNQLFLAREDIEAQIRKNGNKTTNLMGQEDMDLSFRNLMDDLGMDMNTLKNSNLFSGDEEAFAFGRAMSRLSEMGSVEWIESRKTPLSQDNNLNKSN